MPVQTAHGTHFFLPGGHTESPVSGAAGACPHLAWNGLILSTPPSATASAFPYPVQTVQETQRCVKAAPDSCAWWK